MLRVFRFIVILIFMQIKTFCSILMAVFALGVPAMFANGSYSVSDILASENKSRKESAHREFYFSPRKSTLFLSLSTMRLFDMGADARNCRGWGGAFNVVLQKNVDEAPDWKLLFGGELFGAYAWGERNNRNVHFETLNLSLVAGAACDITRQFSAGLLLGYSPIGVSSYKENGGSFHAALSSMYSLRPYVEYNFNPNSAVYLSYRVSYISSWTNVEAHSDAIELGYRLRF